ncbi:MAG: S9 family peptidase [Bacteroidia bacterium]|nr:S9 family peptidase [Bacteroidia bacterium]
MIKKSFLLLCLSLPFWLVEAQVNDTQPIKVSNIWVTYDYYSILPDGFRWMNDDNFYTELESGKGIAKFSVEDEKKLGQILNFRNIDLGLPARSIQGYEFSADEKLVLLKANQESIYRRSKRQSCFVVNLETNKVIKIHSGKKIINPSLSPDNQNIAYVYDNNIYYTDLNTGKEVMVTNDGKYNEVINGLTDWVYEEEFAFVDALKWSPDGKKIGFYRFDESEVKMWTMPLYGQLYPEQYTFKYPKAGEANSKVSIHIFDVASGKTTEADLGPESDQYVPRIKWNRDGSNLAVMVLNRLQNKLDLVMVNPENGAAKTILTENSNTYITEVSDDKWHFLEDGKGFLWMSEDSGYMHIFHHDMEGKRRAMLTSGEWEVDKLIGVDEDNKTIYYTSTEVSPLERHLYKINFKGKAKKRLTEVEGTHSITKSSNFTYFLDTYSNTKNPPVSILMDAKGKEVKKLRENEQVREKVARHGLRDPEFFNFTYTPSYRGEKQEDVNLNGFMIKPADFDESKKYPVLMFVYGGPGSQEVLNKWAHGDDFNYMWFQMLAQKGYIVACVDNRGTGGRGKKFRDCTYANLGRLETLDQINAARYLSDLPYVDSDRIGIWGWSYGGYMTSLCMTKGQGLFKAGIAIAPVTNWRFYDTIYTERFLKRPQDNQRGYDENSPINFADQLKGNFLVVHGTGDDNVHFQNTIEFTNALISYNKQFELFFYPNRTHGIFGGNTRYHLYTKMTNFILDNL